MNFNRLVRLAINPEGFVFDPQTGESFTANISGQVILKALQEAADERTLVTALQAKFDVTMEEASADVRDFIEHLKILKLL